MTTLAARLPAHTRDTVGIGPVTLTDPLSLAWLDWMDGSRIPAHTVARRRVVLRGLGNAGTATRGDVETWWTSRAHLSAATRANDLACLRAFYKWCARWEHRDDDPTRRLDPPRTPRGQPRPMPYDDLWAVLDWCDAHGHHDMRRAVARLPEEAHVASRVVGTPPGAAGPGRRGPCGCGHGGRRGVRGRVLVPG